MLRMKKLDIRELEHAEAGEMVTEVPHKSSAVTEPAHGRPPRLSRAAIARMLHRFAAKET
jgi:hypothetical protein